MSQETPIVAPEADLPRHAITGEPVIPAVCGMPGCSECEKAKLIRSAHGVTVRFNCQGIDGRPLGCAEWCGDPKCHAGVEATLPMQPTPYGLAGIEGDAIVIRLTADACAFAFANDPQAREPRPPVTDKQQFLRDTLNELTAEREDGSTPLTDMLDRAMVKAMENGSDALDHDAAPGVKEDLNG